MNRLDDRLSELFVRLDTRPGFEQRVEARIASLSAARADSPQAGRKSLLQRQLERAREAARRDAWLDGLVLAAGGVGAMLATWIFAPRLASLAAGMTAQGDVAAAGFAWLAVVALAMWLLLKGSGIEPRSLIGA